MVSFEELPKSEQKRLLQDEDTLRVMTEIYCAAHHADALRQQGLCPECRECLDYSISRTRACPKLHKGSCAGCEIHCYKPEMRAQIRAIMAYAGPRMIYRHPVMAVRHLKKRLRERRLEKQA